MAFKRRTFLGATAAGAAIGMVDWLRYFKRNGVPGSAKELGIAKAAAAAATDPHFLLYWFLEGGVDGFSMFNPVDLSNDATGHYADHDLNPSPPWSAQHYRPIGWDSGTITRPKVEGNITYGYLAQPGLSLFPDLAVVASHKGGTFHSGSRFEYHYGKTGVSLGAARESNERTVTQAFCEAYGASYLLPNVSWHRWLSDGELSEASYPQGTGYFENLGPSYAHTIYGQTPTNMRAKLHAINNLSGNAKDERIRAFVDNLHDSFMRDKNSESVRAFAAAVETHRGLITGELSGLNIDDLFTDPDLRSEFNIVDADEQTTATEVNGNPARSKNSPNTNVQALMTYELMTRGLSTCFFLESREVRGYDNHRNRRNALASGGSVEQSGKLNRDLWDPLKALVNRLKNTEIPSVPGTSYWDYTTIAIASEMGRSLGGNVDEILTNSSGDYGTDDLKYAGIMDQDVVQHWEVSSCALLGGTVKGGTQWGKLGSQTLEYIPMMPDGSLDPAFDATTGVLKPGMTKSDDSFVSDAGHLYSTALYCSGLNPAGKGKNTRPAMTFIKK
jgi:hypothetical protein